MIWQLYDWLQREIIKTIQIIPVFTFRQDKTSDTGKIMRWMGCLPRRHHPSITSPAMHSLGRSPVHHRMDPHTHSHYSDSHQGDIRSFQLIEMHVWTVGRNWSILRKPKGEHANIDQTGSRTRGHLAMMQQCYSLLHHVVKLKIFRTKTLMCIIILQTSIWFKLY